MHSNDNRLSLPPFFLCSFTERFPDATPHGGQGSVTATIREQVEHYKDYLSEGELNNLEELHLYGDFPNLPSQFVLVDTPGALSIS